MVADVVVHLPQGQGRIRRRFSSDASVEWLFVMLRNEGVDVNSARVATRFPRKTYSMAEHGGMTFEQAQLCPHSVLFTELV